MATQSNSQLPSTIKLAIARLQLVLTKQEIDDFRFTTLEDVERAIHDVQKEQAQKKCYRDASRISTFLQAVKEYGTVIEVFLNASSIIAFIWGPIKFLVLATGNVIDVFDTLMDAYQALGESMPLLRQYQTLSNESTWQDILFLIYADILEFHREAVKVFKRPGWKLVFSAMWKGIDLRLKKILADLRRHSDLLQRNATLMAVQQSEAARTHAEAARAHAELIFERQTQMLKETQARKVSEWLGPVDMTSVHGRHTQIWAKNTDTCKWLWADKTIERWLKGEGNPGLWVCGIPGAGKTIIASALIEKLKNSKPPTQGTTAVNNSQPTVLFFYFKYKDDLRSSFLLMARTMLKQLLNSETDLLPFFYEKATENMESVLRSEDLARELLGVALGNTPDHCIVVDGLDECEKHERSKVLSWIQKLGVVQFGTSSVDVSYRILVVSTEELDIKKKLSKHTKKKLTSADVEQGLVAHLNCHKNQLKQRFDLAEARISSIMDKIRAQSNGMFLYAHLVLDNLLHQPTKRDFDREVSSDVFPQGLGAAYDRIVHRISDLRQSQRKQALRILGWVTFAERELGLYEINGANSIDTENGIVDFDGGRLRDDVRELCGSLVEVHGDTVLLVHNTAKLHLMERSVLSRSAEQLEMALLCLQYLQFDIFLPPTNETALEAGIRSGKFAFLEYAFAHWLDHVFRFYDDDHSLSSGDVDKLQTELCRFQRTHWKASSGAHGIAVDPRLRHLRDEQGAAILSAIAITQKEFNMGSHSYLHLDDSLRQIRLGMERILCSSDAGQSENLRSYYGPGLWKCDRPRCLRFHKGYEQRAERDEHLKHHIRPFRCTQAECIGATIGFTSKRGLLAHERSAHKPAPSEISEFPSITDIAGMSVRASSTNQKSAEVDSPEQNSETIDFPNNTEIFAPTDSPDLLEKDP